MKATNPFGRTSTSGEAARLGPMLSDAASGEVVGDRPPLPLPFALKSLGQSVLRAAERLAQGEISQPTDHLGHVLHFSDGSHGRVYRETVATNAVTDKPVVLIVAFRLRWLRGWGHALFRAESLLNTPLFVGFPGFVSKLWVAHDQGDVYRGVYQWNDAALAHAYVRTLWWVLALVSERRSIRYIVLPGRRLDEVLADPTVLDGAAAGEQNAWWRLTAVTQRVV